METAEAPVATHQSASDKRTVRVLVVGQTPPPFHGQSLMIKMLLDGQLPGVEMYHVRMAFSDDMNQVGRFQFHKVLHLFVVILKVVYFRIRFGTRILYYPPAGPNLVPLLRDIVLLLSTRWLFAKTIFHFHACGVSELIKKLPCPLKWLAQSALSRPSAAVQLSELTGLDAHSLNAHQVYTIPNASHDEAEVLHFERHRRSDDSPLRILYVGTVCEGKGVMVLLDAVANAAQTGKNLKVDIVGSYQPAEFREQVEQRIEELQLKDVVQLWGQQTGRDKWQRFADADVFCFPSFYHSEGFPCVLLEAMCFSLPIISTQWRGIPSIVEHGKTGYLTATHDPIQLSNYLQALADDPDLCLRLGACGRQLFCERYTVEKYLQRLRRTFLEIGEESHSNR